MQPTSVPKAPSDTLQTCQHRPGRASTPPGSSGKEGRGEPSVSHLYGDVQHESRLSRVSHAHHPDPICVAHAHLLQRQRDQVSVGTLQGVRHLRRLVQGRTA